MATALRLLGAAGASGWRTAVATATTTATAVTASASTVLAPTAATPGAAFAVLSTAVALDLVEAIVGVGSGSRGRLQLR